jgi:lysozyme
MNPSLLVPKFLAQLEGCSLVVYRDQHNLPTIGIGHLLTKGELMSGKILIRGVMVDYSKGLSQSQADDLSLQDLSPAVGAIRNYVAVDLEQCQYDALCLFIYNVGAGAFASSTLLNLLNQGQYDQVPDQMRRWNHVAGAVSAGLTKRREQEILVWAGKWNG